MHNIPLAIAEYILFYQLSYYFQMATIIITFKSY